MHQRGAAATRLAWKPTPATPRGSTLATATAAAATTSASRRTAQRSTPKKERDPGFEPGAADSWGLPPPAISPAQLAEELSRYAVACAEAGISNSSSSSHGSSSSSSSSIIDRDSFVATCLEGLAAPHRLSRLRPSQLAAVLAALAALGAAGPGPSGSATASAVATAGGASASTSGSALEDFLADVDAACYCHPGPFSPASVTSVMQSLARLHAGGGGGGGGGGSSGGAVGAAPGAGAAASRVAASEASAGTATSGGAATAGPASSSSSGSSSARVSSAPPRTPSHYSHRQLPPRPATAPAGAATATEPAPYRFPHAVRLRLLQPGGAARYSYSQLAALLQAFRCLGHPVDEAVAGVVGGAMAEQLTRMGPAERAAALEAVLGAAPPCGGGGSGDEEVCGVA
ncbi:hypothetical protein HYH02_012204 [Chlamydomonas schloesseri]|uniref:Uncharacterized protein n=1 Tax=Chlamydomonas schloesseri TaxID=2026947 RepID=A0A835SZX4_9CHLO|nr:hypothetical protein HYH02_012204 [Chlamydomonas schloesseri]|eukprot:KAG2434537.1 hypothetical protein HYH02_012204 [Chlamydomonas schloesseri]